MEKQINSKELYKGKIITVYLDDVLVDDKNPAKREVVKHRGGACVALKDEEGYYYLVRQYRYAIGREMLEFAAGKLEEGEAPEATVIREAQEELGLSVKNLRALGNIIPTCGYCTERIYLYYGEANRFVGQHLDEDERIMIEKYTFKELKELARSGQIEDAKTLALILKIELEGLDG